MKYTDEQGKTLYYTAKTECCGNRVEWYRGEAPDFCPHCGDKYFTKPGLEYKLFHLQDQFIADFTVTGSTRILGEKMFPLIHEYAENLIKGLLKGRACISPDSLYEKANDAATRLIEVILKTPDHRMRQSFGGYLQRLCKSVAYEDKETDKTYSMEFLVGDETEFGSIISRQEVRETEDGDSVVETLVLNNQHDDHHTGAVNDLSEDLCRLIQKSAQIIQENTGSRAVSMMYLIGLHNKLRKIGESRMDQFYTAVGREVRSYVEKGELVVYKHLKGAAPA
jgi:hypothetical protein